MESAAGSHLYILTWPPRLPTTTKDLHERHFLHTENLHWSVKNPHSLLLVGYVRSNVKLPMLQLVWSIWHVLHQHGHLKYWMYDWYARRKSKIISYLVDSPKHLKWANVSQTHFASPSKSHASFDQGDMLLRAKTDAPISLIYISPLLVLSYW